MGTHRDEIYGAPKKLYAKRETCETKLKSLLEKHGAETAEALAMQTEALRSECARTEKALAAAKEALTLAQKQYTRALQFEQCQKPRPMPKRS